MSWFVIRQAAGLLGTVLLLAAFVKVFRVRKRIPLGFDVRHILRSKKNGVLLHDPYRPPGGDTTPIENDTPVASSAPVTSIYLWR